MSDHLARDNAIRPRTSHLVDMHRLLRFSPFKKAREQANAAAGDASGNSGSSEANRSATDGTDSQGPAYSGTKGVTPESKIDVSVLTKSLPPTSSNQLVTDMAVGSSLEQGQQGKLTHMRTGQGAR